MQIRTKNSRKKRKIDRVRTKATKAKKHEKFDDETKNYRKLQNQHESGNGPEMQMHEKTKRNENLCPSHDPPPIGGKINATNPGPLKILEGTKKTKIFRFLRKIHEKSDCNTGKLTKNDLSC